MAESQMGGGAGGGAPALFIVELDHGGERTYAVCEQFLSVGAGTDLFGIPADQLRRYLETHAVLAAPVPPGRGVGIAVAGKRDIVNVSVSGGNNTINLSSPTSSAPPPPPR